MQSKSKQTAFLTQPVVVGLLAMLCCMLWGSAFPCVKIGYRLFGIAGDHTPSLLLFAGLRFTLAGLLALCIGSIGARRWLIPKPTSWPMILKLGLVQTVTQYIFFYIGVAHASGVKSSIIVSANVFFSILISAIVLRQERMTAAKLLGCIAGFAGVVLINTRGGALDFSMQWNGEGFVLISSLAYAISSVMVKQYAKRESPVTLSGYQFVWGGCRRSHRRRTYLSDLSLPAARLPRYAVCGGVLVVGGAAPAQPGQPGIDLRLYEPGLRRVPVRLAAR